MSTSEDGERMLWVNNGISMEFQKPSRTIFGRLTPLIFKAMVAQATLDVLLQTQDGGKFSDMKVPLLRMREVKLWK
jgi:hypothetical protein